MSIIIWLILGLIAGFIASKIVNKTGSGGLMLDIVLGVVGAMVGGFLFSLIGAEPSHWVEHLQHHCRGHRRHRCAVDLPRNHRPPSNSVAVCQDETLNSRVGNMGLLDQMLGGLMGGGG